LGNGAELGWSAAAPLVLAVPPLPAAASLPAAAAAPPPVPPLFCMLPRTLLGPVVALSRGSCTAWHDHAQVAKQWLAARDSRPKHLYQRSCGREAVHRGDAVTRLAPPAQRQQRSLQLPLLLVLLLLTWTFSYSWRSALKPPGSASMLLRARSLLRMYSRMRFCEAVSHGLQKVSSSSWAWGARSWTSAAQPSD
jgi:hypothetical protein